MGVADAERHLIVIGDRESSGLLASATGYPLGRSRGEVTVGTSTFRGEAVELAGLHPDPGKPERYLATMTPGFPSDLLARLWIEPDYVVTDGDRVLARGFFDDAWRADPEQLFTME
jgi:hypothetical protein